MFDLMLDLKNTKWILIHKILLDEKSPMDWESKTFQSKAGWD